MVSMENKGKSVEVLGGKAMRKDFMWGAASAAHQVEGAYNEDGKGLGIWDALVEGHIKHRENGNVACDHYHRYKEDIQLMKKLGLQSYRFSVSWPRIMPEEGKVNPKGIAFYQDLVKELRAAGIEPMCTLFHWNLPMWIHEKGGWKCDAVSDYFAEYAKVVVDALSDQVSYWMTVNEPACFLALGYITGAHAPFEEYQGDRENQLKYMAALGRNVLLAHGKAVKVIRDNAKQHAQIGFALNGRTYIPKSDSEEAVEAARAAVFSEKNAVFGFDFWADPIILGKPGSILAPYLSEADMHIISQPIDFFGFNEYNSDDFDDYGKFNENVTSGLPRTAMDWVITPDVLYWDIKFLWERYHLPILVTENGMANLDFIMSDGKVHDIQRIEYMKWYISSMKKAIAEGYDVIGYCYWSIMDNYEWAEGYDKRFGLIHIDYSTKKRTVKDSGYWYAKVIENKGEFPAFSISAVPQTGLRYEEL